MVIIRKKIKYSFQSQHNWLMCTYVEIMMNCQYVGNINCTGQRRLSDNIVTKLVMAVKNKKKIT